MLKRFADQMEKFSAGNIPINLCKGNLHAVTAGFLSFFIPCLILFAVFKTLNFYPFGTRSFLILDMFKQYSLFYESLWQIPAGDGSIFFSWSKSMGSNFIGLFAYYLSSPLLFILFLFGPENVEQAVLCLTVIKISLCGLSSYACFTYMFGRKSFSTLVFSTSYALMPYNIIYSQNLMWLDGCILLPVVLVGAEKILRDEKPHLFVVSLFVMFVANYYIACMAGVFCALFIIGRYLIRHNNFHWKSFFKIILKFASFAAVSIGMASWLILPALLDLTAGKIGFDNRINKGFNFSLSDYGLSFSPQTYTSSINGGMPALYSGLVIIILCLIFFALKSVSAREKIITLTIFIILLLSFYITKLDNAWHGFVTPTWFPYRYAFTFHFLSVFTACNIFFRLGEGFNKCFINEKIKLFSVALTRKRIKLFATVMVIFIMAIVCLDLYGNTMVLLWGVAVEFEYEEVNVRADFRNQNLPLIRQLKNVDDSFYRIEKTYEQTINDALGLGYKGIAHSSSMFTRNLLTFVKKAGLSQGAFAIRYSGSTVLIDSVLNIRYIMSKKEMPGYYNKFITSRDITAYENPYVLPLGFMVDKNARNINMESINHFENQNNILNGFTGDVARYFKEIEGVRKGVGKNLEYDFTVKNNFPMYLSIPSPEETLAIDMLNMDFPPYSLYINGEYVAPYFRHADNHVAYIGQFEPGMEINVAFDSAQTDYEQLGEYFYYLDMDEFEKAVKKLKEGGLYNIRYKNSHINAEVKASRDGLLFTSIPYDNGFTVKVDGKKTPYEALCGAFIAFAVDEGHHIIEITFIPRGFITGLCISIISLLSYIAWVLTRIFHTVSTAGAQSALRL